MSHATPRGKVPWPVDLDIRARPIGLGTRVGVGFGALVCVIGVVLPLWGPVAWPGEFATEEARRAGMIIAALAGVFGVALGYGVYLTSLYRLRISSHRLIVRGSFKETSVDLDDIFAWSIANPSTHGVTIASYLVLHGADGEQLALIDRRTLPIEPFEAWVQGALPDLETLLADERRRRAQKAIEDARLIGSSPTTSTAFAENLEMVGCAASGIAGPVLGLTAIFAPGILPLPASQALLALSLVGVVLGLVPSLVAHTTVSPWDMRRKFTFVALLAIVAIFNWCDTILGAAFLSPGKLLACAGLVAVPCIVFAKYRGLLPENPKRAILPMILVIWGLSPLPFQINRYFDQSQARTVVTKVLEKSKHRTRAGDAWRIVVEGPRDSSTSHEVLVEPDLYTRLEVGSSVTIKLYRGTLNSAWLDTLSIDAVEP